MSMTLNRPFTKFKAVPIFLATLVEFWKALNLGTAFKWYWRVLTGSQGPIV